MNAPRGGDEGILADLRTELTRRFVDHPPGEWSPRLLRAMIDVMDLGFPEAKDPRDEGPRPGKSRLRLVK